MARWGFGLRAKAMGALLAAFLLALIPLGLAGWQLVDAVRSHFGEAYARNFTDLHAQRIITRIQRDLALSRQLADSTVTEDWVRNPDSEAARDRFFREAERYRDNFRNGTYFLIDEDGDYYLNEPDKEYSRQPRYTLDPEAEDDEWFFNIMADDDPFVVNVNTDEALEATRVWLNVVVTIDGERRALAGTGLDLSRFLEEFVTPDAPGVTPFIIDGDGAFQAHPDPERIAYGSGAGMDRDEATLPELLSEAGARDLQEAMAGASGEDGAVETLWTSLDGQERLLALTHVPELDWYVATAVDLQAARVMEGTWLRWSLGAGLLTLLLLLGGFAWAVNRLVLRPVRTLQSSASAMAEGNYQVSLPAARQDEIGDLSHAFGSMAEQVRAQTEELEDRVQQRTRELEEANREMASAQRKVSDSIDYAGLIQRALLPDAQLEEQLGSDHFVLWHPRDGVGGDFYLFHSEGDRFLIGVVDCAGHGVPGALMTMLARAAFDDAVNRLGIESPASLLHHADTTLREMVRQSRMPSSVATNLDAGLACVDRNEGLVRYAGARIGLHWSDGEQVDMIAGGRRALCDRRHGEYTDEECRADPATTFYMVTDGYLDQAGGEQGFGFGNQRFTALLREHARRPLEEQALALEAALSEYRGEYEQRDDITVLAFRLTPNRSPRHGKH
ncbi:MAG: biofilm regulation protein phosphatase SiaA [Pseudomonadota bacterium]